MTITRTGIFTDSGGTRYMDVGGVLRNTGSGWQIFGDGTHQSMNLLAASSDSNFIYVTMPTAGVARIVHFLVTTDESLAAEGIFCGASVVIGRAKIAVSQNCTGTVTALNPSANPGPLVGQYLNFWISGRFQMK